MATTKTKSAQDQIEVASNASAQVQGVGRRRTEWRRQDFKTEIKTPPSNRLGDKPWAVEKTGAEVAHQP